MSSARWGQNWADVDEDDDEDEVGAGGQQAGARFETPADKDGIKTVWEYIERDGKTFKVAKKVRVTTTKKWTTVHMKDRKTMEKFGKAKTNSAEAEQALTIRSVEEVNIELCRKPVTVAAKDDAEDKFLEESLTITENLFKEKKVWTDINKGKQDEKDLAPVVSPGLASASAAGVPAAGAAAAGPGGPPKPGAYVPPSLRGKGADGKGDGKGKDGGQEASLRITNLSDDVREGDLQDLFAQFGRLQRVYLAKDPTTNACKGFAFVTYYTKAEGQRAIDKLHGHGYDNLILQVQWAKPKE